MQARRCNQPNISLSNSLIHALLHPVRACMNGGSDAWGFVATLAGALAVVRSGGCRGPIKSRLPFH